MIQEKKNVTKPFRFGKDYQPKDSTRRGEKDRIGGENPNKDIGRKL